MHIRHGSVVNCELMPGSTVEHVACILRMHTRLGNRGRHRHLNVSTSVLRYKSLVTKPQGLREGSFEGFECRWQGVPSFRDHKLALLVAAVSSDAEVNLASYRKVSDKIAQIERNLQRSRRPP